MSLLTIVQNVCGILALPKPATVINSQDLQVAQLYALALEEAREQAKMEFQALIREQTFVTVADPTQTTAVPTDLRSFINNSFYNRTTRRPMLGPITPQLWQNIQANPQVNRIILAFRQRDGAFLITPTPPAGQTIGYEYFTNKWARSADLSEDRTQWVNDSDTSYLDETLIELGLRWRWRAAKGLPYGENHDTYMDQLNQTIGRDGGNTVLNLTGGGDWEYVGNPNIPETGFGV